MPGWAASGLVFIRGHSGETSSFSPQVESSDKFGQATASGIGRVAIVEVHKSGVSPPGGGDDVKRMRYRWWPDLTISLNHQELDQRIWHEHGNLKDPKAWSQELNKALKQGLIEGSTQVLFGNSLSDKALHLGADMSLVSAGVTSQLGNPEQLAMASSGVWALLIYKGLRSLLETDDDKQRGPARKSLFAFALMDRLAVIHGLAKTLPLVKQINP